MSIIVAYATKHGATQGIAERIAERLAALGQQAHARPAQSVHDLTGYDAFVIGSAAYMGSWLKEATEFVRRNQAILATRPVWLFSSSPLGTATTDAQGRDLRVVSEPKEFAEFKETIKPRGIQVFYGVLDPHKLGFAERVIRSMPAGRTLLPEGDFRDWQTIDAWAESIAHDLAQMPADVLNR
ncbi:MAG TPA: flavodoxin domain-containing protein [Ktedonobacterales bacterium]